MRSEWKQFSEEARSGTSHKRSGKIKRLKSYIVVNSKPPLTNIGTSQFSLIYVCLIYIYIWFPMNMRIFPKGIWFPIHTYDSLRIWEYSLRILEYSIREYDSLRILEYSIREYDSLRILEYSIREYDSL